MSKVMIAVEVSFAEWRADPAHLEAYQALEGEICLCLGADPGPIRCEYLSAGRLPAG